MIDFEDQATAEIRKRDLRRREHDLTYPGGRCRRCGIGPHEAGEQPCKITFETYTPDPSLLEKQAEFIQRMWITWCDTGDERYWRAYHRAVQSLDVTQSD